MAALAPDSLDDVRVEADRELYPRRVLAGCETALVLFAGAFFGRQDAVWIHDAGMRATCVDVRPLDAMAALYPAGWEFVEADAFEFCERSGGQWDVVSVDCPTNLFRRCAESLPLFCDLARRAVVLGSDGSRVVAPAGWVVTETRQRSSFRGGVYWDVIERAS